MKTNVAGINNAINDLLGESIRKAILAADVFMGNDENCLAWLNAHRAESQGQEEAGERQRRRSRRAEMRPAG